MKKLFSKLMFVALAAMTFAACEDVPEAYDVPGTGSNAINNGTEIEGGTGSGTLADPFNAIAALNYGNKLAAGEESPNYMYIKGKVVSVKEEFGTQYGNGTFYISEDGTSTNQFYAYRVLYLGNKKFAAGDDQIKPGDDVVVCGIITNYNGTVETAQNKGFLYKLNGVDRGGEPQEPATGEATGTGTLEDPFNAVAAINYAKEVGDNESPNDVYIKGKVASITDQYGTEYGNATFLISEDGTTATTTFTIYRALYLGNKKYTSGDLLKEGDEVIICGKVTNFKGNTPETVTGKAFLYSLNGVTDGGETPGPTPGEATGSGTLEDPYNSVAANDLASSLGSGEESPEVYVKGKVVSVKDQYNTQYGNATFYISDDGTAANQFYVFRALYLGNQKYTSGAKLQAGDEVIIYGKLTNYQGNTPETVQNAAYLYSLNGSTEPTEDPTPKPDPTGEGSYDEPYSVASVIANGTDNVVNNVYVSGYIVGWVDGQVLSSGARFSSECTSKTNLLLADDAAETDVSKCIPIQLPNNDVRTGLNLQDHPEFYGKQVKLYGNLEKYFGAAGVKSVTYAEAEGQTFGAKP